MYLCSPVLLLSMMIPEDQQSYIRSMSLCTLKESKVNKGLETRSCWESPCISKHLELSEKVKLLICPLRKRIRVVWSRLLQSIDRQPPGQEP
ncbi:hypothetical protein AVEN_36595-1 [Araneus ventricosus]|uniref:Uncharacterized protein n=1 Tax=Araneus ventricosus TaxID=182803 RepID=A0A4Y2PQR9_ARAVE|nr:hypothetical protein AVEN_36595-1 [Araneus ventricosus]